MDQINFFKNLEETNLNELIDNYLQVFLLINSNNLSLSDDEALNLKFFFIWFNMIKMITKRFKIDNLIYYDDKDKNTSDDVYDLINGFIKNLIIETTDKKLHEKFIKLSSVRLIIQELCDLFIKNKDFQILPPLGYRISLPKFDINKLCIIFSNFYKGYLIFKENEKCLEIENLKQKNDYEELYFIDDEFEFRFLDLLVYRYFKKYHSSLFENKNKIFEFNLTEKFYFDNDLPSSNDQLIKQPQQSTLTNQTSSQTTEKSNVQQKVLTAQELFKNYLIKENQLKMQQQITPQFKQSTSYEQQSTSQIRKSNIQESFHHYQNIPKSNYFQPQQIIRPYNQSLVQNDIPQFTSNQSSISHCIPFFQQSQFPNQPNSIYTTNNPLSLPIYFPSPFIPQTPFIFSDPFSNYHFNKNQQNQNRNESQIYRPNIDYFKQMSTKNQMQSKFRSNQQIPQYKEKIEHRQNLPSSEHSERNTTTNKTTTSKTGLTYADILLSQKKK